MASASDKSPRFKPDIQNVQKFWLETDILVAELAEKQPNSQFVEINKDAGAIAIASVQQQIRSEQIPNRLRNEPPR